MKIIRTSALAVSAAVAVGIVSATPVVTFVDMEQAEGSRKVTITYKFSGEDAVITLDVQTNATGGAWASIGGEAVANAQGEVWRKVERVSDSTVHTITWRPDLSWPDHLVAEGGARAVVTAWAYDNTPDYMVVDLAVDGTVRYYPSVDFLPGSAAGQRGAITNNTAYRMSKLVMRKIMAKDVEWTMGSTALEVGRNPDGSEREAAHNAQLTNNYYIGVFPVTQEQWALVSTANMTPSFFAADRAMRPVENVCFNEIRMNANNGTSPASAAEDWPSAPFAGSFLDILRSKTGIDFDLPSEAQWEFACRAGNGDTYWGDGSSVVGSGADANLDKLSRYSNPEVDWRTIPADTPASEGGTSIVGTHAPNSWGLYDMHGNVGEWCLDWFKSDITALNGAVNTTVDDRGFRRMIRGGAWNTTAAYARSACRANGYGGMAGSRTNYTGFRLACTGGIK